VPREREAEAAKHLAKVPHAVIGRVTQAPTLRVKLGAAELKADCARLKAAWQQPLKVMET
jgi:hypothetical protein